MGIQDRDYYREHWQKIRADEERAKQQAHEAVQPSEPGPPDLVGSNWHWTLRLVVWMCIAVLTLIAGKLIG